MVSVHDKHVPLPLSPNDSTPLILPPLSPKKKTKKVCVVCELPTLPALPVLPFSLVHHHSHAPLPVIANLDVCAVVSVLNARLLACLPFFSFPTYQLSRSIRHQFNPIRFHSCLMRWRSHWQRGIWREVGGGIEWNGTEKEGRWIRDIKLTDCQRLNE